VRNELYSNGKETPNNQRLNSAALQMISRYDLDYAEHAFAPVIIASYGHVEAKNDSAAVESATGFADPLVGIIVWLINKPDITIPYNWKNQGRFCIGGVDEC
jgi:hypothetical protein